MLVVRSLNRETIKQYFPHDVYYDSTEALPYHTSILRAELQELMFIVLESIEYTHLLESEHSGAYGQLLKMTNKAMQLYPDYENVHKPVPREVESAVPEAAKIFAGMFLSGMMKKTKQIRL